MTLEDALADSLISKLAAAAKKEPEGPRRWPAVAAVARALQAGTAGGLMGAEAAAEALAVVLPLLAPPAAAEAPAAAALGASPAEWSAAEQSRGAQEELLKAFEAAARRVAPRLLRDSQRRRSSHFHLPLSW